MCLPFVPFSRSISGPTISAGVRSGRSFCRGVIDRGKGPDPPRTFGGKRVAGSVGEETPSRGMAVQRPYPSLEALRKLEASLNVGLCEQDTPDDRSHAN